MMWSFKCCCLIYLAFTTSQVWSQHFEPRTNHTEVNSKDYLWVCAVYAIADHFPIGTCLILTHKWVLTPAHFWDNDRFTAHNAAINYNATVNQKGEGEVGIIGEIFHHPKYHHRDQDQVFNVAMLLMASDMKLGWHYGEVLPIEDEALVRSPGDLCEVTGYGVDENQKPDDMKPRHLKTIQVEIKETYPCVEKMFFSQEMVCAAGNLCPVSKMQRAKRRQT
jgi:Trypsin